MSIKTEQFGVTKDGKEAVLYTAENKNGMVMKVTDYGANLVALLVPDREGKREDVVLGYDNLLDYHKNSPNFGSIIGRHANRIGGAFFSLNGTEYHLDQNDGNHNLHSGFHGYHKRLWSGRAYEEKENIVIELSMKSPDQDQGFPGNLTLTVNYILTADNEVRILYHAASDQDTIANFTNHSYFNLAGHDKGTVLDQKVWINGDYFTPSDEELIPTGEILPVAGTPMDFTAKKTIGQDINSSYGQLQTAGGFDHNWVLKQENQENTDLICAAKMEDPKSGRGMEVWTDLPGMQFYTANFLTEKEIGKGGTVYQKHAGACFETQFYPDSVHHLNFPSPILKAGREYHHETRYHFYICEE